MWDRLLDQFLRGLIRRGTLDLRLADGQDRLYGDGSAPRVRAQSDDPTLARRIVTHPDLALGEAYADGRLVIDGDDLNGLMALIVQNLGRQSPVWWRRPADAAADSLRALWQVNPLLRARANVAHHYDLSERLYRLFLDDDMQYSCAYFRDPADTLDRAQAAKKAHIIRKLRLEPEMRVLDIGCGWGGMAITLARDHGARVTGITLSEEQARVAAERVRAAGLSDRVEIRIEDYRRLRGRFDRIVSVGMFEHVGVPQYRGYFGKVRDLLPDNGVALLHTIGRMAPPRNTSGFIRKHIFPGGYVPTLSEVMRAVERSGLWAADVEIWRLHYAETLRHWRNRFDANRDAVVALYDERFVRLWRYYLIASEMAFRHGRQCVFQIQLSREVDAVPLTRDYLCHAAD